MFVKVMVLIFAAMCMAGMSVATQDVQCNKPCQPGSYQVQNPGDVNCTSFCVACKPDFISNITDAVKCIPCPTGETSNPSRTKCHEYDVITYALSRPGGVIIILLIVFCGILLVASIILFTKKRRHELVISSNYYGICSFLIGCLLVLVSSIPLLTKPLVTSCSVFIGLFSIGLTLMLAVLISRSAYFNNFFNEEGVVVKTGCGTNPRGNIIILVVLIQLVFLIVGLTGMKPETLEIKTSQWNILYLECSNWASIVFWIALAYNVLISLFGNFLSCSSTQMENNCDELKHIIMAHLVFYFCCMLHIIIIFRLVNQALAEGQAIICILYSLALYSTYIGPKVYVILFCTKADGTTIKPERLLHHEHEDHHTPASIIHAKDGYKTHVVGVKIKSIA